ncbi:metalloregulator ArsR/SmtB family transcription factor [Pseudomonas aeruginosa]|uniref:metalloregulator ArsR/SmtB family transcription factor n=1 Tax=Pseudomonas aeruginosa TaxID=287 RepID=UPI00071BF3F7|nr:metalloregulator ArsR/SmtB family transcription factor [Pseudomonas aeruginosa]MCO1687938.1 metalloregulator ArsR/SmtB family transcription factor [Pseudomonas aeruginosa]MCO1780383.1 metalloregulator ArsR/SmtB family transcription factor [Pseudomonas aeruginosa]MCO1790131.1 metalloregulator ArsR/SmtB family transcription factor [Pseudomonas aeruginosa]MCO1799229.1 metalloregulator ArsR/SmtB family transcription factor [Pseudomonas aeruginosa]MDV6504311.1 metalloregulator ArsR/SmtB family t
MQSDSDVLFRPLADATRRAIFELLLDGPKAVKVISAEMPITQSAVSQHLKVLKSTGLVLERRQGRRHFYAPNPAMLERLSLQFGNLRDKVLDTGNEPPGLRQFDEIDSTMEDWAQAWPEHDGLSVGIIVRLRLAGQYLEALSQRAAARYNLNSAQVLLLATLDRPETPRESNLTELSRICHISLPATSRHIEHTEQLGLIVRRHDPDDARSQLISLTDAGRELIHHYLRSQREYEHSPVYRMGMEERLQLAKLLRPLLRDLRRELADGSPPEKLTARPTKA